KGLIAGFNISHVQVRQHVGNKGEQLVGDKVMEVQDARRTSHQKPRTKHHVSVSTQNRTDEQWNLARIVLKIGVLNHDDVALCQTNAGPQRRSLASIAIEGREDDVRMRASQLICELGRAVSRTI